MSRKSHLHWLTTAALFAAAIAVMTAYMFHIPIPTGGYIHLGDALIYLAACLLPAPYAAAAAAAAAIHRTSSHTAILPAILSALFLPVFICPLTSFIVNNQALFSPG